MGFSSIVVRQAKHTVLLESNHTVLLEFLLFYVSMELKHLEVSHGRTLCELRADYGVNWSRPLRH